MAELNELFIKADVALGFPIESRVKQWSSISEKLVRKSIDLTSVIDLSDLVGVRVVLLFRKDLERVKDIISKNFDLISSEDTGDRLGDSEFGYQSHHYSVKVPQSWLSVPTLAGLGEFTMEFQVRTLAQHIWAAASHKLQYKQEAGVPPPIRRSINRVSALLETVDLELQRVLEERGSYTDDMLAQSRHGASLDEPLNVDNLAVILGDVFPSKNKAEFEDYSDLLDDINQLGVAGSLQVREIFDKHYGDVMKKEHFYVSSRGKGQVGSHRPGVYFRHVGMGRQALRLEFGDDVMSELFEKKRNS
ncbi:GTP pyrophosphokinase family protein [Pseudomonas sp. B21-048]|uniref:GTP pyrophosphokinase n=1 Tax=Pseudomonas sp. B21-048 TaxID=2895490 RepID=UPI00215DDE99|nr:RelA/SpoT domain-containing protein [Pseudomonas sp. B21-048]UVK96470.1 RelA/SpoT domain-containing protein [Pseudomonas sp. B21-048]